MNNPIILQFFDPYMNQFRSSFDYVKYLQAIEYNIKVDGFYEIFLHDYFEYPDIDNLNITKEDERKYWLRLNPQGLKKLCLLYGKENLPDSIEGEYKKVSLEYRGLKYDEITKLISVCASTARINYSVKRTPLLNAYFFEGSLVKFIDLQ